MASNHKYYVKTPSPYDASKPYPVIFMFNPTGNPITWAEQNAGYESNGAKTGAIRVYPDPASEASGWGAGDVSFFMPLYDAVIDAFCVDKARVFAAGESSGGDFSSILGCEYANVLRAVAPCATKDVSQYPLDPPRRELHGPGHRPIVIHGQNDNVVGPANGPKTRDFYRALNHCGTTTTAGAGLHDRSIELRPVPGLRRWLPRLLVRPHRPQLQQHQPRLARVRRQHDVGRILVVLSVLDGFVGAGKTASRRGGPGDSGNRIAGRERVHDGALQGAVATVVADRGPHIAGHVRRQGRPPHGSRARHGELLAFRDPAGEHALGISLNQVPGLFGTNMIRSYDYLVVCVELEAGHVYRTRPRITGDRWQPEVVDVTTNRLLDVRCADDPELATPVVAAAPPPEPAAGSTGSDASVVGELGRDRRRLDARRRRTAATPAYPDRSSCGDACRQ